MYVVEVVQYVQVLSHSPQAVPPLPNRAMSGTRASVTIVSWVCDLCERCALSIVSEDLDQWQVPCRLCTKDTSLAHGYSGPYLFVTYLHLQSLTFAQAYLNMEAASTPSLSAIQTVYGEMCKVQLDLDVKLHM